MRFYKVANSTLLALDSARQNLHSLDKRVIPVQHHYNLRNQETAPCLYHKNPPALPSHHPLQFLQPGGDLLLQGVQFRQDVRRGRVLDGLVFGLLVFVDRQEVVVLGDLALPDQEGSGRAGAIGFGGEGAEAGDDVRDVVLGDGGALVVQGEAVSLHIIEPDLVRAAVAGLGEDEDGGGHAGVGLEHAGGHGDHGLQAVVFDELPADGFVGRGGAEEDAVGHDAGAAAAHPEHPQKQGQEQEFRLLGLADLEEIGGDDVRVQTPLEGGVGQDQGIPVPVRVLVGEAVPILDEGVVDAVGHHVHGADAEHGPVHVEAVEHVVEEVVLLPAVEEDLLLPVLLQVFPRRHQKARGAAGRVYKDAVFDTNEYPGHRRAEAGNIKKSRAFAVPPVIPAEL